MILKLIIILPILIFWIWTVVYEPYLKLVRKDIDVHNENFGKELNGLKIAVIGDMHFGAIPFAETWRFKQIIKAVNESKPDIIFIVGDFVNGRFFQTKMSMKNMVKYFKMLEAPLGVFACTGNHDFYWGVDNLVELCKLSNITLLLNENKKVEWKNGTFYVAAIEDPTTSSYSYTSALAGIPEDANILFLTHNPSVIREIPSRIKMSFAGHIHNGQIRLPFLGEFVANNLASSTYMYDLNEIDDKLIYVTGGLGTSRVPLRLNCFPEWALIRLFDE